MGWVLVRRGPRRPRRAGEHRDSAPDRQTSERDAVVAVGLAHGNAVAREPACDRKAGSGPRGRVGEARSVASHSPRSARAQWRARMVPSPPPVDANDDDADCATCTAKKDKRPTHRCGYRPWKELLRRSLNIDVERCDKCGGRMKMRALVMTSAGIDCWLVWLGEPTDPPTLAPSRGPPWFKRVVIRRKLGESVQAKFFDTHRRAREGRDLSGPSPVVRGRRMRGRMPHQRRWSPARSCRRLSARGRESDVGRPGERVHRDYTL